MIDPAVLDAMLAAGATPEVIVAAVKADQAKDEARREAKRANNAERQQRYRDRNNADNALRDVTSVTPPILDKEIPPTPPKEINPTPRAGRRVREAVRLADDWKPSRFADGSVARSIIDQRGQEWAKRALESFKNHWRSANGPNARKRDWQAAWANWVIEQDNRDGRRPTNAVGRDRGQSASGRGTTVDAAQGWLERRAAANA